MGNRPQLHAAFVPGVTGAGENPYQELLARGLEACGVDVAMTTRRGNFSPEVLAARTPDVVHLHWLDALFLSPRRWVAKVRLARLLRQLRALRSRGVALVWTAHNLVNHKGRHPDLDLDARRRVAALVDAIIAHGPEAARTCRDAFEVPDATPVSIVPHGSYEGVYGPIEARGDGPFRFGFVGLLRPHKGVRQLVEAFVAADRSDAELLVAGEAEDDAYLESIRAAARGHPGVRIEPTRIPDDRLASALAACDALVFPYEQILTSGAAILAMSYGRALIAPDRGCFRDDPGTDGGLLYDPNDANGLKDALIAALDDRDGLARMGRRNLRHMQARSWTHVGALTREVYERAMQNAARTAPRAEPVAALRPRMR